MCRHGIAALIYMASSMLQYRVAKERDVMSFIHYELNQKNKSPYIVKQLRYKEINSSKIDLINGWRRTIESAFGSSAESKMPCWHGHYDQFGVVMLYLTEQAIQFDLNILEDEWFRDIEYHADKLLDGAVITGLGDPIFHRAWLSMIGHPDFVHLPISRDHISAPNICNLHWLMGAALTRLNEQIYS